jgi:1-acyl-sn-glycerol-3-phosphate acyltransferase
MSEVKIPPDDPPEIASARRERGEGAALGRDPFDDWEGPDPFVERLDQLESRMPVVTPARPPVRSRPHAHTSGATEAGSPKEPGTGRGEKIARITRRRWTTTPLLSEIDAPDAQSLTDRLISPDERKRLVALNHLVEADGRTEALYDRFGFSPAVMKNSFPLFHALYRFYFRVQSEGHANVPAEGPVVLAGNHGGLLPFDGAMAIVDLLLNTNPPRLARTIVDRWAGSLPWVNIFFARVGQVIGTRENFASLLDDGQAVMVFPEGIDGIRKTIAQRYQLQPFRVGFVEHALRSRAAIVPMAIIGSDNQTPILYDIKPLARRLGLPVAPITPTFPLLGPLGLLPYPVRYKIVYGEPLRFHERFGAEAAGDARLVRYLAKQVRRKVQLLIDRNH